MTFPRWHFPPSDWDPAPRSTAPPPLVLHLPSVPLTSSPLASSSSALPPTDSPPLFKGLLPVIPLVLLCLLLLLPPSCSPHTRLHQAMPRLHQAMPRHTMPGHGFSDNHACAVTNPQTHVALRYIYLEWHRALGPPALDPLPWAPCHGPPANTAVSAPRPSNSQ